MWFLTHCSPYLISSRLSTGGLATSSKCLSHDSQYTESAESTSVGRPMALLPEAKNTASRTERSMHSPIVVLHVPAILS